MLKHIFLYLVFQVLPAAVRKTGRAFVHAQCFLGELASEHSHLYLVPEIFFP